MTLWSSPRGAAPIRPPLPGIDLPGIFVLRTIPDSRKIRSWITEHNARRAVVVGGGLVGLEMAENLTRRGIAVTVIEMLDQVLPPLDAEMAQPVHKHLVKNGVALQLGDAVAGFAQAADGTLNVATRSGLNFPADLAILAIGVRPETKLAKDAGLALGARGGIRVDANMRTSDPRIWAVGDAVESRDFVTGQWNVVPLAGPANRQGRVRGLHQRTQCAFPRGASDGGLRGLRHDHRHHGSERKDAPGGGNGLRVHICPPRSSRRILSGC